LQPTHKKKLKVLKTMKRFDTVKTFKVRKFDIEEEVQDDDEVRCSREGQDGGDAREVGDRGDAREVIYGRDAPEVLHSRSAQDARELLSIYDNSGCYN
jgi:hypothetical protein